jgi:hypothetical protein
MKFLLCCFTSFLFSIAFAQNYEPSTERNGPQMTFDQNEIIDTITVDKLVEGRRTVAMNRYEFHFTNTGKQPLLVGYSNGSDPDFNCSYPNEPVKPGGRGTIVICAEPTRWRMDKTYHINSTSVIPQTIHIKRVPAISDSDLVLNRRHYESHCMRMYVDSLPYSKRESLKDEANSNLTDHSYYLVDTTKYYLSFDDAVLGKYGAMHEKAGADIPHGTMLRVREEEYIMKTKPGALLWTNYYYDDHYQLLEKRITTFKEVSDKKRGVLLFNEEIITYKNGIETERRKRILTN